MPRKTKLIREIGKNPFTKAEYPLKLLNDTCFPTQEVANQILDYFCKGYTINQISQMRGMPEQSTILRWTYEFPEFGHMFLLARATLAHLQVDEIMDTVKRIEAEELAPDRANAIINAKKWLAQNLNPDIYGERKNVKADVTGNMSITISTGVPLPEPIEGLVIERSSN